MPPIITKSALRVGLANKPRIWFEDMTLAVNDETTPAQTIIKGHIIDQAALFGLINRIRDLGLTPGFN